VIGMATNGRARVATPTASDPFLLACGAVGPVTVLVVGPGESDRRRFLSRRAFLLVGRHPRACVSLSDQRVCPRHLYLQVIGGHLYGVDLGSRAGVYHGVSRFSSGWVAPNSFLRLGPYHISVEVKRPADAPSFAAPDDPISHPSTDGASFPPLSADLLIDNVRRTGWKMTRRLVLVGRDPAARLRLRDRSVSRFHCALVGTPRGTWVVDLLSREGTLVNDNRVSSVRLLDGDRLRVGCYELVIRTEEPGPPPGSTALSLPAAAPPGLLRPVPGLPALPAEASALLPILQQFGMFQQQMLDQFQQSLMLMLQTFAKMNSEQMDLIRDELSELRRLTEELHEARQLQTAGPRSPASGETPSRATSVGPIPTPTADPPILAPPPASEAAAPDADVHAWLSGRIASLETQRQGVLQRVLRKITGR
jgi:pSer/pThr/pTyr-binding forkhead associated (FHA) protein